MHRPSSYTPIICCSYRNWTYDLFLVRELFLTTELRSNEAVSLTSNYSKEGSSKSSTLWKHENIVWTLWDLNSSKTLQMSCANLITLQSPLVWVLGLEPRTTGSQSQHSTYWITPIYYGEMMPWPPSILLLFLFSKQLSVLLSYLSIAYLSL